MSAQQTLMEPTAGASGPPTLADFRFISVVVPVVERSDDLVAVYRAFGRELDARPQDYEFLFVFDGRFTPSPELVALARENDGVRILRFAREFGETAALRLGIEKSRGDLSSRSRRIFRSSPKAFSFSSTRSPTGPTWS